MNLEEFINVYYKDAAPEVQQFFDEITSYCYMMNERDPGSFNMPTLSSGAGHLLEKKANWPEAMLVDWVELFEQAYAKIMDSEQLTADQKVVLEIRIDNESIWPRYWLLKYYGKSHYTDEEYAILREEVLRDAYRAGYVEAGIGGNRLPE